MSEAFKRYRSLERDLIYIRWQHAGLESEEEDSILEDMDVVWYELSEEEQQLLYNEGTKSLIRDASTTLPHSGWVEEEVCRDFNVSTQVRMPREAA